MNKSSGKFSGSRKNIELFKSNVQKRPCSSATGVCFLFIPLVIFSLYFQLQNPNDAIAQCNEALKLDENDVDALCDRAEAHILNEMYDEGEIIHSEEAPTLKT